MRYATLIAWLGAAGCGGDDPAPEGAPGPPEEELPSPYVAPEGEPPVASADLAEIEAAAQAALDGVRATSGRPVEAAYAEAMAGQEGACPSYYANDYGTYWFDSCTSGLGTTFSGYAFAYGETDLVDPFSGFAYTYWVVYGGATILDADTSLELSGTAYYLDGVSLDGLTSIWETTVQGTFAYDGVAAGDTWLAGDGGDPDLYLYAIAAGPAHYLLLDGGYSGFGDVGLAASFESLEVFDAAIGTTCPEEPGGAMAVRSGDGGWYDLVFHGATSLAPADDAQCDGCADVFYQGEPMGLACIDVAPVLRWASAPW
jgi:hypothetical protein